jgi:GntR family transcriptional regulator/MocR family aminotransferase
VLPRSMVAQTRTPLQEMLRGGHRLEQWALANFIESGEFGRHLGRMRRLYRERQQALREALATHFEPAQVLGGNCGMHLTLRLPPHISDRAVVDLAQQQQISARALSGFTLQPQDEDNGLVIGYGNTSAEQIETAVRSLARCASEVAGTVRPRRRVAGARTWRPKDLNA